MRVVAGIAPALAFEAPHAVLRGSRDEAARVWDEAERALADGRWIAGYVEYGGTLAIGVYDEPSEIALPNAAIAHSPLLPCVTEAEYARKVALLQRGIYEGDVYQVNYTVPFELHTEADPYALWSHYAPQTHGRYQAYVEDGDRAIASWSPELFLAFDGQTIRTRPMKGTAQLDAIEALNDPKNRAEHVMIVDLLRNDLQRVCD
ncbi:MAG: chorismate-binding protein, partial [Candidatus Eremiobacteraeota bacterium]|nr:chorismate-binding protein [Candidatus Eremiobacteraeota bacterium]